VVKHDARVTMGCLASKEKENERRIHTEQSQRVQQRRNSDGQRRMSDGGGQRRHSDSGPAGQRSHNGPLRVHGQNQGRRSSQSSSGSNNTMDRVSKGIEHRDKERVVTDPRGGRRVRDRDTGNPRDSNRENGAREDSLSKRNQFDRASQLRRSKKRKKSKENIGSPTALSPKTAKDIVSQETEASQSAVNNSRCRTEYHSKYGNLI